MVLSKSILKITKNSLNLQTSNNKHQQTPTNEKSKINYNFNCLIYSSK